MEKPPAAQNLHHPALVAMSNARTEGRTIVLDLDVWKQLREYVSAKVDAERAAPPAAEMERLAQMCDAEALEADENALVERAYLKQGHPMASEAAAADYDGQAARWRTIALHLRGEKPQWDKP
jgi:hypothetical protein